MSDTKTRILDAAEQLFGRDGFEYTSLRAITTEAQVNLAAVNYHFQSKDALIDAVLERRIGPVTQRRLEMLDAAEADPAGLTLEKVIEAFAAPVVEAAMSQPGLAPLMGRIMATPGAFLERVFLRYMEAVKSRFLPALLRCGVQLPPEELFWRLHFMVGSLAHVLVFAPVMPAMSNGLCQANDARRIVSRLVAFCAAGMRAPVEQMEKQA